MKEISTFRDLLILEEKEHFLVTATDSCGGVGEKQGDCIFSPTVLVGKLVVRVPLVELLAVGAKPLFMTLPICNDEETAKQFISGVEQGLDQYKHLPRIASTETNISTSMTGVGVSITGIVKKESFLCNLAKKGDYVALWGEPVVGAKVLEYWQNVPSVYAIEKERKKEGVSAIIPIGSRGIEHEAKVLALEASASFMPFLQRDTSFWAASAGPATAFLITGTKEALARHQLLGRLVMY